MATTYVQDVSEQTDRVVNNVRKLIIQDDSSPLADASSGEPNKPLGPEAGKAAEFVAYHTNLFFKVLYGNGVGQTKSLQADV